jgi:hypothetical protein
MLPQDVGVVGSAMAAAAVANHRHSRRYSGPDAWNAVFSNQAARRRRSHRARRVQKQVGGRVYLAAPLLR